MFLYLRVAEDKTLSTVQAQAQIPTFQLIATS